MPKSKFIFDPVSETPRVFQCDGFATNAEIRTILQFIDHPDWMQAQELALQHDETGASCEIPIDAAPVFTDLADRLNDALGIVNIAGDTFRYRKYGVGEGHPPHCDHFRLDGKALVATAMLILESPRAGGRTVFPQASPKPVKARPKKARLVYWFNHQPDGRRDYLSEHFGENVHAGTKTTLTWFVYAGTNEAGSDPGSGRGIARRTRRRRSKSRFFNITSAEIEGTNETLEAACAARRIEYIELDATTFSHAAGERPQTGDLLYRSAIDMASERLENALWHPGIASFTPEPWFICVDQFSALSRAGIGVPRTIQSMTTDRDALAAAVEHLGGFPVIVKVPGGEGGRGVIRADSLPSLFSIADHVAGGAILMEFIPHQVAYRLVVVGDKVVDSEARAAGPDEFRTNTYESQELGAVDASDEAMSMAIRAAAALRLEFGGADILVAEDGRLVMTEFNSPCYFADQELLTGTDISGAMIDYLLSKVKTTPVRKRRRAR